MLWWKQKTKIKAAFWISWKWDTRIPAVSERCGEIITIRREGSLKNKTILMVPENTSLHSKRRRMRRKRVGTGLHASDQTFSTIRLQGVTTYLPPPTLGDRWSDENGNKRRRGWRDKQNMKWNKDEALDQKTTHSNLEQMNVGVLGHKEGGWRGWRGVLNPEVEWELISLCKLQQQLNYSGRDSNTILQQSLDQSLDMLLPVCLWNWWMCLTMWPLEVTVNTANIPHFKLGVF